MKERQGGGEGKGEAGGGEGKGEAEGGEGKGEAEGGEGKGEAGRGVGMVLHHFSLLLQIHEAAGAIVKLNTLANELPPSPE